MTGDATTGERTDARSVSEDRLTTLRELVLGADRELVDLVSGRVELVRQIQRYKREHGLPSIDERQEGRLLDALERTSAGRLSPDGLRYLHRTVLSLTKQELGIS